MQRVFSRRALWLPAVGVFAMAALGITAAQQGPGTPGPGVSAAVEVVTYIEVVPGTERPAAGALKSYRDIARQEAGNQRVDLLQQAGRPSHFVILESWENKSGFDAHAARPSARALSDSLTSKTSGNVFALQLVTPIDQRLFNPFNVAMSVTTNDAVFVVTHVDTIPPPPQAQPGAADPGAMLKQLAEASRREDGNLRFDVWQSDRKNHFTLVEAWRNQKALDAHTSAAHTRQYRSQLQPLAGSPLDERTFSVLK